MPTVVPNNPTTPESDIARPVINGRQASGRSSMPPQKPRRSGWKVFGAIVLLLIFAVIGIALGTLLKALKPGKNESGSQNVDIGTQIKRDLGVIGDPRSGFPDMGKMVICCMGIDDNWTNSDEVYTAGSRTDTLFLLTLDLDNKKVTMLSIPRDTYVPIAGTNYSGKINAAFATGGPARTEATITQWLGVKPDYYMVLNIDATKRLVDALGGVDVNVEHPMDYDDAWGHLHVHLKPGEQHLDGDQAVGFARFRHANHGITPEDGDERRMYRQHVLMQAMMTQAKSISNVTKVGTLIDTGMESIRTDLRRDQIADLGVIFHGIDPANDVVTASLIGDDARGAHGEYVMSVDQNQAKQYVAWLVNGDENAGRALTSVRVVNATSISGLASTATNALKGYGYANCALTSVKSSTEPHGTTTILDTGVANHAAARDIATLLAVPGATITRHPATPNKFGWTPPADIEVTLGTDYASNAKPQ